MAKFVKCPKCGSGFKAPAMDQKRSGLGYTIPGLGVIECPSCHLRDRRKRFSEITEEEANLPTPEEVPEKKSESETIDDSRFESE